MNLAQSIMGYCVTSHDTARIATGGANERLNRRLSIEFSSGTALRPQNSYIVNNHAHKCSAFYFRAFTCSLMCVDGNIPALRSEIVLLLYTTQSTVVLI
jgi:hypothetical protein